MNEYRFLTNCGPESACKEDLIQTMTEHGHTRESALEWILDRIKKDSGYYRHSYYILHNQIGNSKYRCEFFFRRWMQWESE